MKIAVWGGQIFDHHIDEKIRALVEEITASEKKADFYFFEDNAFDCAVLKVIKSVNPKFKAVFVTREKRTDDFKSTKKELLSHGYDKVELFQCENNSPYSAGFYIVKNKLIRRSLNECDAAIYYFYPELDWNRIKMLTKPIRANLRLFRLSFKETEEKIEAAKAALTEEEQSVMQKVMNGATFTAIAKETDVKPYQVSAMYTRAVSKLHHYLIRSRLKDL